MTLLTAALDTEFDLRTTVVPHEDRPGEFTVELDGGWSSLVWMHGGYMSALATRAAETLAPDRVVRTMSTSFLRSGRVGPAALSVRELRRGRSMTTMVTELVQDDQILIVTQLTLMTARSGIEWSEARPLDLPPPEDCVPFSPPAHDDSTGGLAVEHGRLAYVDGTVVAESFQTRLTAGR